MRDPLGNLVVHDDDLLGRRVVEDDGDAGQVLLRYNGFDELVGQILPDGSERTCVRDALGRVVRIDSVDGTTTYTYDAAAHGIGQLSSTRSPSGVITAHAYDDLGRPATNAWLVHGELHMTSTFYDGVGRLSSTVYPSAPGRAALEVQAEYGPFGHLRAVRDPSRATPFWQADSTDAAGHLLSESFGNGVTATRGYDPARGWLTTIAAQKGGTPLQSLAYAYDVVGRLTTATDGLAGRSESYGHDALDRLTTWTTKKGATTIAQTAYAYDLLGNLTDEDVQVGPGSDVSYTIGGSGAGPHQVTSSSATGLFGYDARGRQTQAGGRTVTFTDFDLPATVTRDGQVTTFEYDALHARVRKAAADEVTTFIAGLYERRATSGGGTTHVFHVRAGARPVADVFYDQATGVESVSYLHGDRLGSTALVTADGGQVVERLRFDPWGVRLGDGDAPVPVDDVRREGVRLGFTGHSHDDELGLVDMGGRVYDSHQRRFLTQDPIVVDATSSQAFNPYAYVRNSPLEAVDPTGFEEEDCSGGACLGLPATKDATTVNHDDGSRDITFHLDEPDPVENGKGTGPQGVANEVTDDAPAGAAGPSAQAGKVEAAGTAGEGGVEDGSVGGHGQSFFGEGNGPLVPGAEQGGMTWMEMLHLGLDVLGLVPGIGEVFDLANAGIYLAEGDYTNAALSAGAAIPGLGWGATALKDGAHAVGVVKTTAHVGEVANAGRKAEKVAEGTTALVRVENAGRAGRGAKEAATAGDAASHGVFQVTPDGVVLPPNPKYEIPKRYVENPDRIGSYGEMVNGKYTERLRIDPPTPRGRPGPGYSHYHLDRGKTHYSPRPGEADPGFSP